MPHSMPSKDTLDCIKACGECASLCNQCSHHCLQMGGEHASPEHQGIMRDCAEICGLAACFMGRSSTAGMSAASAPRSATHAPGRANAWVRATR